MVQNKKFGAGRTFVPKHGGRLGQSGMSRNHYLVSRLSNERGAAGGVEYQLLTNGIPNVSQSGEFQPFPANAL
jgi:hypothetical protein